MEPFTIETFFAEKMKDRGYNAKRLAEASGISIDQLELLLRGELGKLPPAPYLHGYITKLATFLDFDPQLVWEEIKKADLVRTSGPKDRLPENRFVKRSIGAYVILGILCVLALAYVAFRFPDIVGEPILTVSLPAGNALHTNEGSFLLTGTLENGDSLLINGGESIPVARDGTWQKRITLQSGLNSVELVAKKFLGREVIVDRQIFYDAGPSPLPVVSAPSSLASTTSSTSR